MKKGESYEFDDIDVTNWQVDFRKNWQKYIGNNLLIENGKTGINLRRPTMEVGCHMQCRHLLMHFSSLFTSVHNKKVTRDTFIDD